MPITREDLDAAGCDTPGCTRDHSIVCLIAGCHPEAGTSVAYDKRIGALRLACCECGGEYVEIAVARSEFAVIGH